MTTATSKWATRHSPGQFVNTSDEVRRWRRLLASTHEDEQKELRKMTAEEEVALSDREESSDAYTSGQKIQKPHHLHNPQPPTETIPGSLGKIHMPSKREPRGERNDSCQRPGQRRRTDPRAATDELR
jgi:hypothetical protein